MSSSSTSWTSWPRPSAAWSATNPQGQTRSRQGSGDGTSPARSWPRSTPTNQPAGPRPAGIRPADAGSVGPADERRVLVLGAMLAAMTLAGMTAVAQAQANNEGKNVRRPPTEGQVGETWRK